MKPQPGEDAPDFSMQADDGTTVSRESQLGERYILYFYPKDDTPGCTAQACSLRDNFERVMDTGVEVFGVSPDSVASHVKFRAKYELPYRLLADPGHAVADAVRRLGLEGSPRQDLHGHRALQLHHRSRRARSSTSWSG